jgi:P27 family predicted phage terminase small subunit
MKKTEPVPETIIYPEPPPYLSARSQALWREYAGQTLKSPGQLALFETGLAAIDRAAQARQLIASDGMTLVNTTGKMPHAHPALNILKEAEATALKVFKTLGLHYAGRWASSIY